MMGSPITRLLLCAAALACATAALADARAPIPTESLPVPPGAMPMLELSLSDADLLPAIKQALPAIAAVLPGFFTEPDEFPEGFPIKPADVETMLRDVQSIEAVVSMVTPQAANGPPAQAVAQFYEDELTTQGWRRLFWMQLDPAQGSQIVVMAPKAEPGLFGLVAVPSGAGKACMAIAFRVRGTVNLAPVVGLAFLFFGTASTVKSAPPPVKD